jgi:hypothetical protein
MVGAFNMREQEVHTSWRIRRLGHLRCVSKKCIQHSSSKIIKEETGKDRPAWLS